MSGPLDLPSERLLRLLRHYRRERLALAGMVAVCFDSCEEAAQALRPLLEAKPTPRGRSERLVRRLNDDIKDLAYEVLPILDALATAERESEPKPPGGDSSPPSCELDPTLLQALADPGKFVERIFEPDLEPVHRWQARAVTLAVARRELWKPTGKPEGGGLWERHQEDQTDAAIAARERTRRRLEGDK